MHITDGQVHLWAEDTPGRPWPAGHGKPHRPVPMTAEQAIAEMDAAGVARAVIIPPSWEGDRNDVAFAAVEAYPERFAVIGRVDVRDAKSVDPASFLAQPGMLGARLTFHRDVSLADAEWFWPKAEAAGIPVTVYAPGATLEAGTIARRYRDLRVIVDQLNMPNAATLEDLGGIVEPVLSLAELDNVAVKV